MKIPLSPSFSSLVQLHKRILRNDSNFQITLSKAWLVAQGTLKPTWSNTTSQMIYLNYRKISTLHPHHISVWLSTAEHRPSQLISNVSGTIHSTTPCIKLHTSLNCLDTTISFTITIIDGIVSPTATHRPPPFMHVIMVRRITEAFPLFNQLKTYVRNIYITI